MAAELVAGWDGIADEDGSPIRFGADALAAAMDIPYFHDAVRDALIEDLFGRLADPEKNSATPGADGRPASAG